MKKLPKIKAHRFSSPACGDTDPNAIYIEVGKALTAWEFLEDALAELQLMLEGVNDLRPLEMQKSSYLTGGDAREKRIANLLLIMEGRHQSLTEQQMCQVRVLVKACKDLAERRNDIAHGEVVSSSTQIGNFDEIKDETWYLVSAARCGSKKLPGSLVFKPGRPEIFKGLIYVLDPAAG